MSEFDRQNREDELRKHLMLQQQKQQQEFEAEQRLNEIINFFLTDSARARLNNVKLVNKELYFKAVQYVLLLYRSGRISEKISENDLLLLLKKLSQKKEMKIVRK